MGKQRNNSEQGVKVVHQNIAASYKTPPRQIRI